jgi:type II secretory pathway component PulK
MAILIVAVLVAVAATVFADYKWRRWMAARRAERDAGSDRRA